MQSLTLIVLLAVLPALALAWNRECIKHPVGFGHKTYGGKGGRRVVPRDAAELKNLLCSKEKLIIDLDKTYDFTNTEGWASVTGCFYRKCAGNGFQESLAHAGTCNGKPQTTVKYAKAGLTGLVVSSFKTIMSSCGRGHIKGKGLIIKDANQVIVQDITISDINDQVIWAGDAITLDNAHDVWLHKLTVRNIGRQHVVTNMKSNTGITVSSCFFDGTATHSATCNGRHYWMWLIFGTHDEITFINNHIRNSAARLPHAGGWDKAWSAVHLIGNYIDCGDNGLEPNKGSYILAEGNQFVNLKRVVNRIAKGGRLALVDDNGEAGQCHRIWGQNCLLNKYIKTRAVKRFDADVLNAFSKLDKVAIESARKAVCL